MMRYFSNSVSACAFAISAVMLPASVRMARSSAAVWPWTAKYILCCSFAKTPWLSSPSCRSPWLWHRDRQSSDRTAVFQSLVVHDPALDGVVLDDGVGPLAKLDGPFIVDFKAHSDHHLQAVVHGIVLLSVAGCYPKFSDN